MADRLMHRAGERRALASWRRDDAPGLLERLATAVLDDAQRWPLWCPVGLAVGIAIYFSLPFEPPAWAGPVALLLGVLAALAVRGKTALMAAVIAATLVAGGFAAAQLRSYWIAAPVLEKPIRTATVVGRVVQNAAHDGGGRILLEDVRFLRPSVEVVPARVRMTLRAFDAALVPGDWVELRGGLMPPAAPAQPGAFDFQRKAYFEQLGAVGYGFGSPRAVAPRTGESGGGFAAAVGRLRHAVTERIAAGLDGQAGAVAAALLTGMRGAIDDDVLATMRDAGLAHLLAISGLHIGLFAAILFFSVRALLALIEPVALRHPIKKWAAIAALVGTAFYLLLSGMTIPTQRAFLMGALVIVGILLDRSAMTMRAVAWAAVAVLILQPESLLGPSFQMSFAAVIGLVATYEALRDRERPKGERRTMARRVLAYFAGVVLVTVIATLATAPFAIYHFNRVAVFGLAANFLAVPMTAMWIMPWGIVALVLMPLGLENWALAPMGWGIDWVIAVARTVAGWPGAVELLPAMPTFGLLLTVFGGLWLCLWRHAWRLLGIIPFIAGLAATPLSDRPDILVDGEAKIFAVAMADGALALSSAKTARYDGETWLRRNGQKAPAAWPGDDDRLRCDASACIYRSEGHVFSLIYDERALAEDCRVANVVVSLVPVRGDCPSATAVIDRFDIWREGAHAVYLDGDAIVIESVASRHGMRPWSTKRKSSGRKD